MEATLVRRLGNGRAAEVFLYGDGHGRFFARKLFSAKDLATKLVNYFAFGVPDAGYSWDEDANKTTFYRRKILEELLPFWTDGQVRIAKALDTGWDEEAKAHFLDTEFIDGRAAALHTPFTAHEKLELSDLVDQMHTIQEKAMGSGLDGLLWQAGYGNPTATANFMIDNDGNWVMIDTESGIPACAPTTPYSLLFYLGSLLKYRRPLFDDIDTKELEQYVSQNQTALGKERFERLIDNIDNLNHHQTRWKSKTRIERGIAYQLKKGKIGERWARRFMDHPYALWYPREIARAVYRGYAKLAVDFPTKIYDKLTLPLLDFRNVASNLWKAVSSQEFRKEKVKAYIQDRVDDWENRKQISSDEADYFKSQLETAHIARYLIDLSANAGIKFLEYFWVYVVQPTLLISGKSSPTEFGANWLLAGPVLRSAYTLGRMGYIGGTNLIKNRRKIPSHLAHDLSNLTVAVEDIFHFTILEGPKSGLKEAAYSILELGKSIWGIPYMIALCTGAIPKFGNLQYPAQMLVDKDEGTRNLAKFLIYDSASRLAAKIPIYGGKDTRLEHLCNHIADYILKPLSAFQLIRGYFTDVKIKDNPT